MLAWLHTEPSALQDLLAAYAACY